MLIVSPFLFLWTNPLWFQWQIYAVVIHAKMGQTVKWTTMNTIATAFMVLRGATVRLQVKLKVLNNSCTWFYVENGYEILPHLVVRQFPNVIRCNIMAKFTGSFKPGKPPCPVTTIPYPMTPPLPHHHFPPTPSTPTGSMLSLRIIAYLKKMCYGPMDGWMDRQTLL